MEQLMEEEERGKEKKNRREYWITQGIVVKLMNKTLADGKYYKVKGVVQEVIDKYPLYLFPLYLFPLYLFPLYIFPLYIFPLYIFPLYIFPLYIFPLYIFPLSSLFSLLSSLSSLLSSFLSPLSSFSPLLFLSSPLLSSPLLHDDWG
jgi:KN17 SH3-like C-terminal domain